MKALFEQQPQTLLMTTRDRLMNRCQHSPASATGATKLHPVHAGIACLYETVPM